MISKFPTSKNWFHVAAFQFHLEIGELKTSVQYSKHGCCCYYCCWLVQCCGAMSIGCIICVFPICSYLIRPNWFNPFQIHFPFQIDWIRTPLYIAVHFFSFFKNAYVFDFSHDLFKNCRKKGAWMDKTDCMTRFRLLFLKIHPKKLSWQDKNKSEWFHSFESRIQIWTYRQSWKEKCVRLAFNWISYVSWYISNRTVCVFNHFTSFIHYFSIIGCCW